MKYRLHPDPETCSLGPTDNRYQSTSESSAKRYSNSSQQSTKNGSTKDGDARLSRYSNTEWTSIHIHKLIVVSKVGRRWDEDRIQMPSPVSEGVNPTFEGIKGLRRRCDTRWESRKSSMNEGGKGEHKPDQMESRRHANSRTRQTVSSSTVHGPNVRMHACTVLCGIAKGNMHHSKLPSE